MKAQHTKGKWEAGLLSNGCNSISVSSWNGNKGLGMICTVGNTEITQRSISENEANAKLIAAAPELLKFTEEICAMFLGHEGEIDSSTRQHYHEKGWEILEKARN